MIRRGSSRIGVAFPVLLFGDFRGGVLRMISCGILLGVTYEDLMHLWLVTLPQEPP
jgi:hypothetical protein